jgi:hypothetical protein
MSGTGATAPFETLGVGVELDEGVCESVHTL